MAIEIAAAVGLLIDSEGPGDRERFADAFREVWEGLLPADREVIAAYWAKGTPMQEESPVVSLVANYFLPGNNDNFGHMLTFNAAAADLFAEAHFLCSLIAHELGHVYRFATESPAHSAFPPDKQAKEDEADAKAEEWGYNMPEMRVWATEQAEQVAECGVEIPEGGRW